MVTNGYNYHRDEPRLTKQRDRIFNLMKDGMKRSLSEISLITNSPEASASAALRDFRKKKFGSYSVEKEYVRNGLWLYWILPGSQAKEESMQGSLLEE